MSIIMLSVILKLIGALIILFGVVLVYDARILTRKFFSFGDQNEGASGLKIMGFIIAIVGGIILFFIRF